jgi:hypothetical protein
LKYEGFAIYDSIALTAVITLIILGG